MDQRALLLIAAVGLYGPISYEIARRRGECAVRMAVSATRKVILQHVFTRSSLVSLLDCTAALLGSLALSRILRSLLFGGGTCDLRTYVGSMLILLVIAGVVVAPARRAASADPASSLRSE